MNKDLHGAAAHSHEYYTVEGGEYDNNRRADGAMLLLLGLTLASMFGSLAGDIYVAIKRRRNVK